MTAPALTFARLADVTCAGTAISDLLDAYYTAMTATTDYRGTALPSTHVWPTTRKRPTVVTESVVSTSPVGTSMAMTPAILVSGRIANAGTMLTPDASGASMLQVGLVKTPGAYSDWASATPMTSGSFSGYWRAAPAACNAVTTIVRVYVSSETIFVQVIQSASVQYWWYIGAIGAPLSTDVVSSAESDGRQYGMVVQDSYTSVSLAWLSTISTFFQHGTSAAEWHAGVFQPGTATIWPVTRRHLYVSVGTVAGLQDPGGAYIGSAIEFARSSSATLADGNVVGVYRDLYASGYAVSGRYLRDGATDLYHVVSPSTSTASSALLLPAVP